MNPSKAGIYIALTRIEEVLQTIARQLTLSNPTVEDFVCDTEQDWELAASAESVGTLVLDLKQPTKSQTPLPKKKDSKKVAAVKTTLNARLIKKLNSLEQGLLQTERGIEGSLTTIQIHLCKLTQIHFELDQVRQQLTWQHL